MNNYFWVNISSFAIFRSCAHKHNYAENTEKTEIKIFESLKLYLRKRPHRYP